MNELSVFPLRMQWLHCLRELAGGRWWYRDYVIVPTGAGKWQVDDCNGGCFGDFATVNEAMAAIRGMYGERGAK